MPFIYNNETGEMRGPERGLIGVGYSGHGEGKNNPRLMPLPMIGPIPIGKYSMAKAKTHPRLGRVAIKLTPFPTNNMMGRSEFFIHGDNPEHIGDSSEGCIILALPARLAIDSNIDRVLEVV